MMPTGQVQLLVTLSLVAMLELHATSLVPVQADISFVNPPRRLAAHQKRSVSNVAVVVRNSANHGSTLPSPLVEHELAESLKGVGNPAMQDIDVASRKPTPVGGSFHVDYSSPARHPPKNN